MRNITYAFFAGLFTIMLAVPASANEHDKGMSMMMGDMKLNLSGDLRFGVFAIEHDDLTASGATEATEYSTLNLKNGDSEIAVSMSTVTDNGLEISGVVEVTSDGDLDDVYAGVAAYFGEVYFGDLDGAAQQMHYAAPTSLPGDGIDNDPDFYHLERTSARTSLAIDLDDDAVKLLYVSPRFAGVQFAASYTPSSEQNGNNGQGTINDEPVGDDEYRKMISVGANYNLDVSDDLSFGVSAGYLKGEGANDLDPVSISAGGRVVWGSYELGGSWYTDEEVIGADFDQTGWSVGLTYGTDVWTVGVAYRASESEASRMIVNPVVADRAATPMVSVDYDKENTALEVGASYALGDGVTIGGQFQILEDSDDAAADGEDKIESFAGGFILGFSF